MRILPLILLASLMASPVFAKFDYDACIKHSLDKANYDQIFKGAYTAQELVELNKIPAIREGADLQRSLLEAAGIPQNFEPATASKKKDSKGDEHELISINLANFHPLDWRDPKKKQAIVEGHCKQMFPSFADLCVKSFYAKEGHIDEFIEKNMPIIQQMSDEILKDPKKSWTEIGGKFVKNLKYDSHKSPTLSSQVYIGKEEFGALIKVGGIVMTNEGPALQVGSPNGNKAELYIIPRSGDKKNPKFLNPYFFVFGEVPASVWNSKNGVGELRPL